jgi:hypothetical protein
MYFSISKKNAYLDQPLQLWVLALSMGHVCYLLGMQVKGHREFHDEAPPHTRTFALFIITNVPSLISQERASFTEEQ